MDINGMIKKLIELFYDQRYPHKLQFKDRRLAVEFSWSKKDDHAFLSALAEATIGQLFTQSMELAPTQGPVETRYAEEPHLVAAVDLNS